MTVRAGDAVTDNLAAALAAVQADLPAIAKGEQATVPTKSGGSYSYRYADLADVSAVILPLLGKHGLAWITKPTFNGEGKFVLAYKLCHTCGDEEVGEYPLPGSGTPQEIGSAITYARRYALCAVTGVAPAADDDDGAAATQHAQRERFEDARPARPAPDPAQARQNILANARAAIAGSPLGGLPAIEERIDQYVAQGAIDAQDVLGLRQALEVRRNELERNRSTSAAAEDRTAEPAEPSGAEPAEQQPMEGDWPEPARPGGSDPA